MSFEYINLELPPSNWDEMFTEELQRAQTTRQCQTKQHVPDSDSIHSNSTESTRSASEYLPESPNPVLTVSQDSPKSIPKRILSSVYAVISCLFIPVFCLVSGLFWAVAVASGDFFYDILCFLDKHTTWARRKRRQNLASQIHTSGAEYSPLESVLVIEAAEVSDDDTSVSSMENHRASVAGFGSIFFAPVPSANGYSRTWTSRSAPSKLGRNATELGREAIESEQGDSSVGLCGQENCQGAGSDEEDGDGAIPKSKIYEDLPLRPSSAPGRLHKPPAGFAQDYCTSEADSEDSFGIGEGNSLDGSGRLSGEASSQSSIDADDVVEIPVGRKDESLDHSKGCSLGGQADVGLIV